MSELRLVLSEAEPLLLKHGCIELATKASAGSSPPVDNTLQLSIGRAKETLVKLNSILQTRSGSRLGIRDRLGWLEEQNKVRQAMEDLRTVRLNVTAMLGVVNS